jgi:nucleotide-binding universal stress UspA family protein
MEQVSRVVAVDEGVVVGDDGSRAATTAVRYAAEEARRRNAPLHVVRAWSIMNAVRPDDVPLGITPSLSELEAATLAAERERVVQLLGDDGTGVVVHVCYGPSAQALIAASETADVLVVGSRGHGGFSSLVLGSVAEQVVRHAAVPVVVVRVTPEH